METDAKNLFFFETPSKISKIIYAHLNLRKKKNILDIGAGNGALLRPKIKNKTLHKIAIEVNKEQKNELLCVYDDVYIEDLITFSIQDITHGLVNNSVYVSNPPFGRINRASELQRLLVSQGLLLNSHLGKSCRIELVFIARVLEAANIGDEAAFIIPTSLLENSDFKLVRETLVTKHNLHTCFILPDKSFKKTEVRTSIVWFRPHAGTTNGAIQIYQSNNNDKLLIDFEKFIAHGISSTNIELSNNCILSSLILSIKRGKSSKNSLLQRKIEHIHTSDLNRQHAQIIHGDNKSSLNLEVPLENVARDGDILIARVGTRVLGKTAIFSGKDKVISDCVVRLRVADNDRTFIFKQLVSEKGQNWLKNEASGSCARILTYDAINNFPIPI
jgi:hypothetical protein